MTGITSNHRYNPCFSGSSIATTNPELYECFLIALQSLFFWQLYCNQTRNCGLFSRRFSGYNPCFSGSSIATQRGKHHLRRLLRLQSLFFWQLYCNSITVEPPVPVITCYNPCFSGSSIATRICSLPVWR